MPFLFLNVICLVPLNNLHYLFSHYLFSKTPDLCNFFTFAIPHGVQHDFPRQRGMDFQCYFNVVLKIWSHNCFIGKYMIIQSTSTRQIQWLCLKNNLKSQVSVPDSLEEESSTCAK